MENMGATQKLAKCVAEAKFEDIPSETIQYSKNLFLSCIGAMLAGSILPAGKALTKFTLSVGGPPEAGVAGARLRTAAPMAALANGTFAHATELEDRTRPEAAFTHNVIPAALALGEKLRLSGKQVLEGFVVGFEVESRTALACVTAKKKGFMLAGIFGTVGSAATAAKMLGFDVEQTTRSLSISTSQAAGLRRQSGTGCHALESGLAAKNGLLAAMLAEAGLTATPDIMETHAGFYDAIAGEGEYDLEGMIRDFGKPYRVMAIGIKGYPSCGRMWPIIDGALDLINEHRIGYDEVESIDVEVGELTAQPNRYAEPTTADEARFSIQHSVAAAFLEKKVFLDSYTDEKVADGKFKEARRKVSVIVHPELGWGSADGFFSMLNVRLKDGRTIKQACEKAKGDPPLYLSTDEVIARYEACVEHFLTREQTEKVVSLVLGLDKLKDVGELMNTLTFPGKT